METAYHQSATPGKLMFIVIDPRQCFVLLHTPNLFGTPLFLASYLTETDLRTFWLLKGGFTN